jgi:GAF domain-containing protein
VAVPLRLGDRTVGALRVYTSEPHDFAPEERTFLAGVANLAACSIANARFHQAVQRVARQVNSTLEVKLVLQLLLRSLIDELNVKAAAVRLLGPRGQRLHLAAAEGLSAAYLEKGEIRIADSPIDRRVLAENGPVLVYDVANEPGFQYPEAAGREGIRSALAVPLRLRGVIVGVLRVYSAQPHRFNHEEIALIEAVADLGAVALDNARLHETLREKYEAAREDWAGWYRYLTFS